MSTLGCKGDVKRLSLQTVHPAETSHMTFSTQTGLCSRQTQEKCLYIPVNCEAWQRSSRKWLQSTKTSESCRVACKLNKFRWSELIHPGANQKKTCSLNQHNALNYIPKNPKVGCQYYFFRGDEPEEYSLIFSPGLFVCLVRLAIESCPVELFKITHLLVVTWKVIHKSQGKHSSFGPGALKNHPPPGASRLRLPSCKAPRAGYAVLMRISR